MVVGAVYDRMCVDYKTIEFIINKVNHQRKCVEKFFYTLFFV